MESDVTLAHDVGSRFMGHLKRARLVRGMTQAQLAKAAGLPQSAISHFESGRRLPSLKNFAALCNALGVQAGSLLFAVDAGGRKEDAPTRVKLFTSARGDVCEALVDGEVATFEVDASSETQALRCELAALRARVESAERQMRLHIEQQLRGLHLSVTALQRQSLQPPQVPTTPDAEVLRRLEIAEHESLDANARVSGLLDRIVALEEAEVARKNAKRDAEVAGRRARELQVELVDAWATAAAESNEE